jgi:hypothetical protein
VQVPLRAFAVGVQCTALAGTERQAKAGRKKKTLDFHN